MSRRTSAAGQAQSIHDADAAAKGSATTADRKRSRSRRNRKVAAFSLVALGLCGLGYSVIGTVSGVELPGVKPAASATSVLKQAPAGSTIAEGVAATVADDEFVDVILDGWSVAALEGRNLGYRVGSSETVTPLTLEALHSSDIKELQKTTPQVLTYALARQLNGSASLECTTDGCVVDGKPVPADALLHGNAGDKELADQLRAYGVRSGLYFARIPVPDGGASVRLVADGYSDFVLGGPVNAGTTEYQVPEADATNGFLRARWLVSAGLGQFFVPEPAWLGTDADRASYGVTVVGQAPAQAASRLQARVPDLMVLGVGEPWAQSSLLSPSQLTVLTSPSKGCAANILCVPTAAYTVDAGVEQITAHSASAEDRTAAIVASDRTVVVDLPAPVRQSSGGLLPKGKSSLHITTVGLFDGADLSLIDVAGNMSRPDDEDFTVEQILDVVHLDAHTWKLTS